LAEEALPVSDASARDATVVKDAQDAHPDLSNNDAWAKRVVEGVLILFLLAALFGPLIKLKIPEEVPPAHSHDEPPGSSHHHGASGEISPHPHD
jgi:hypothetical protein